MSFKFALPLALAAAYLALAGTIHAANFSETGDAGDLLGTAQIVSGAAGTPLNLISGTLTRTNGISDSDLFEIYISSPSTFSASNTAFIPGSNNFDSQIFLFNASGLGLIGNDDNPINGAAQSNLAAGNLNGSAGLYYLLISGSGRYATSGNGLIFPNFTDGTTDPTTVVGPTGPGGAAALSAYTGSSNEGGNYAVALTGAQFVSNAVPEPSVFAFLAAGVASLALGLHRCKPSLARRETGALQISNMIIQPQSISHH